MRETFVVLAVKKRKNLNKKTKNGSKVFNFIIMKGVTFITDETHNKRFVQIDLDELEKHQSKIEDLLDIIIAQSRKDDDEISWEEVKTQLKASGKL